MDLALVTCAPLPDGADDDRLLAEALEARGARASFEVWDDARVDWDPFELAILRSPWDYTRARGRFLRWAAEVGERVRNPPAVLRWNTDKRYLLEAHQGRPVVLEIEAVEPSLYFGVAPGSAERFADAILEGG